jgi:hypothetical protein
MTTPDACYVLARGSHDMDALWALQDLGPLLAELAGPHAAARIAEQIIDVAAWCP